MARLWTGGAEWNDPTMDGITGNTATSTATVRSGTRSWAPPNLGGVNVAFTQVLGRGNYCRIYFNVHTLPSAATVFMYMNASQYNVLLNTDGTMQLRFGTTNIGSPSTAISLDTWIRGELFFNIGSGSLDDSSEFRLDGLTIASETNQTRATIVINNFGFGDGSAVGGLVAFFDDGAINDDQGTDQNTWPGSGKIVLLKPVTDNAIGTGWTLGTGTATGGTAHTAVANTPPLGVADLAAGSDVKQIRNATSNANSNVDENMTDYTTAGLGEYDRVMVVDPIVATAAPVTTGAKQGTVGVASNPTIANVALAAGGTAGAFWSGTAASTFPTGWKISHGTVTYQPVVTKGTAPVMRVTQVTSSTRIAMVCAMGIYVEYQYQPPRYGRVHSEAANRAMSN